MSDICVLLYSSLATDQIQIVNSRRLEDALIGRKIRFEKVDGSLPDNKEIRDAMFAVSGQRGKYPQCFLKDDNAQFRFMGLWDEIEGLLECDSIPTDVLLANPQIKTFDQVFIRSCFLYHNVTLISLICTLYYVPFLRCLLLPPGAETAIVLFLGGNFASEVL